MSSIASETLLAPAENSQATWQNNAVDRHPEARKSAPDLFLAPSGAEIRITIQNLDDLVQARRAGRRLAVQTGFSGSRIALVMTAISELARNILLYARSGEILISQVDQRDRKSIVILAADQGPGIDDVPAALDHTDLSTTGYRGLNSLKGCMDHFRIESRPGLGTQVTCEVRSR